MLKQKPSQRTKRRYLLLKAKDKEGVEKVILDYVGILGWARASPFFVPAKKGTIVLAIDRKMINEIRASFEICKEDIKVLRVSGTLKGLGK